MNKCVCSPSDVNECLICMGHDLKSLEQLSSDINIGDCFICGNSIESSEVFKADDQGDLYCDLCISQTIEKLKECNE